MAENEYLRIGRSSAYRKTRALLKDLSSPTSNVAECVANDLSGLVHRNLRKHELLQVVIEAYPDKSKLRKVIEEHGDQSMARLVRDACSVVQSRDVGDVARYIFDQLSDGVLKNTLQLAREYHPDISPARCDQLYRDTKSSLDKVKPQIIDALKTSMCGEKPSRRVRFPKVDKAHTGTSLGNMSLVAKPASSRDVTQRR